MFTRHLLRNVSGLDEAGNVYLELPIRWRSRQNRYQNLSMQMMYKSTYTRNDAMKTAQYYIDILVSRPLHASSSSDQFDIETHVPDYGNRILCEASSHPQEHQPTYGTSDDNAPICSCTGQAVQPDTKTPGRFMKEVFPNAIDTMAHPDIIRPYLVTYSTLLVLLSFSLPMYNIWHAHSLLPTTTHSLSVGRAHTVSATHPQTCKDIDVGA